MASSARRLVNAEQEACRGHENTCDQRRSGQWRFEKDHRGRRCATYSRFTSYKTRNNADFRWRFQALSRRANLSKHAFLPDLDSENTFHVSQPQTVFLTTPCYTGRRLHPCDPDYGNPGARLFPVYPVQPWPRTFVLVFSCMLRKGAKSGLSAQLLRKPVVMRCPRPAQLCNADR